MDAFVWDIDPIIIKLGPIQLRYYGIIFASMLYIGFLLWKHQMLRGGHSEEVADKFLLWGIIAILVGSRLGHCFFYEPERFLSDPITILYFWKGGLSSHGATVGLVTGLFLIAYKHNFTFLEALDRFAMSATVGAAAVRLGNFLNSEIVGRPTDLPWAVRFPRHDCYSSELCEAAVPRHPSQLYEFFFGLLVLLALHLADRFAGREKRPLGLLGGLFFVLYFSGRFMIEFVKEYQVDDLIQDDSYLTMGQYLSFIPFLFGVGLLIMAAKNVGKQTPRPISSKPEPSLKPELKTKKKQKSKKKKGK